jgi:hypothetical protein
VLHDSFTDASIDDRGVAAIDEGLSVTLEQPLICSNESLPLNKPRRYRRTCGLLAALIDSPGKRAGFQPNDGTGE